MEVYPERQKRQKKNDLCVISMENQFFHCTQRASTQRRVITLGPIFIKMVLNWAQGLKEKSQEVSARKNNNRQRYNKKMSKGGGFCPPPFSFRVKGMRSLLICSPGQWGQCKKQITKRFKFKYRVIFWLMWVSEWQYIFEYLGLFFQTRQILTCCSELKLNFAAKSLICLCCVLKQFSCLRVHLLHFFEK